MNHRRSHTDELEEQAEGLDDSKPHPLTLEHSSEETIRRMRSLPERAAKLREALGAHREADSR